MEKIDIGSALSQLRTVDNHLSQLSFTQKSFKNIETPHDQSQIISSKGFDKNTIEEFNLNKGD